MIIKWEKEKVSYSGRNPWILNRFFKKHGPTILLLFFISFPSFAFQSLDCDEVPVTIKIKNLGQTEVRSYICEAQVYYSVTGIFDFLKTRNLAAADFSRVEGFILDQNDLFIIDETSKKISYDGKETFIEESDLIRTDTGLFLKAAYFSEIFGFHNTFNIRFLSATLHTDFELPSIKAARRKELRDNMEKMKGNFQADTTIQRERPVFNVGAASWNINSTQRTDGFSFTRFNLGLGGLVAGGEFTGNFNHNTSQELLARNQFYRWRYVNNDNTSLRQITVGKIGTRSIAKIFNPVVGVQLTNAPTYIKRSFGTYRVSDYTEPEWMVELYINNVLADFVQADVTGFFAFDVPLMYGSTSVSLRYYGPWGEEEVSHRNINIPFNFLPAGEFEYLLSGGVVEDGDNSIFTQLRLDYGLSGRITVGAGVEFLSSLPQYRWLPFLETSVRLPYNLMLSGQYFHNVGFKGNFTYAAPSSFRVDLDYIKYEKDQQVIPFSYREERKANISMPLNFGRFSGTSRFVYRQNLLQNNTYTNLEWLLTGRTLGLKLNLTTTAFFNDYNDPLLFSRISTSMRLPYNIIFSPQLEYDYMNNRVNSIRGEFKTQLSKNIYLQTSYDQNFSYNQYYINLGLSFDFHFSRLGFNSSTTRNQTMFSQSLGGNFLYESIENRFRFDKRATIGMGSIKFSPFLDLNSNGKRDENERPVDGLEIRSFSGGMKEKIPGSGIIFTSLESYVSYHFKIETHNLDRIAWIVEKKSMNVFVNPNQMKVIEIPVEVVGEIAGYVLEGDTGVGGIQINIYNEKGLKITSMISQADGFFNYMGLRSGRYVAVIEEETAKRLNLHSKQQLRFTIENGEEGAYVDDLEFSL